MTTLTDGTAPQSVSEGMLAPGFVRDMPAASAVPPNRRFDLGLLSVCCLCVTTGCSEQITPPKIVEVERVPFTSMAELEVELSLNGGPTLVEFAQDFNCARCDQMVSTMRDLRAGYSEDVTFHRVNYLSASSRFQLRLCPTYLFVLDGNVVGQLSGNQPYLIIASRLNDLVAIHQRKPEDHSTVGIENENETVSH